MLTAQCDKLRELVSELYQCSRQEGCDHCGYKEGCSMFDRMMQLGIDGAVGNRGGRMSYVTDLKAEVLLPRRENAELRELLAETLMDVHEYAEKYGIEPNYDAVNAHLDARMRELGIEVTA